MGPKIVVDFREAEPTGHHLGRVGDEIEIACLEYLKSTTVNGKYGLYYINKFRTVPDGDIVCLNSNDRIPEGVDWWTFKGWVRDHSAWAGQRETFVGHPRGIINRWRRAQLRKLRTCSFCGLPQQHALPPYACSCIEVAEIDGIDWAREDPEAIMLAEE